MLRANGLTKLFGSTTVLRDADLFIGRSERIGLVGANGTGKTTLLRLLAGLEQPDQGTVIREGKKVRVGLLPQEIQPMEEGTVLGEMLEIRKHIPAMEREMRELETRMADYPGREGGQQELSILKARYGELQDRFESEGGFEYESEAKTILFGLGFRELDMDRPLKTLSGGWRMKLALGRLLLDQPDVLLLDEPTNHLDLASTCWLESYLQEYPGAYLLISHDRYLLNRLVRRIMELSNGRLDTYTGDFDTFLRERQARREILLASKKRQDQRIKQIEDFVARNRVRKDRARQAQSRLKLLDKIERIEVAPEEKRVRIAFPQPSRSGADVIRLEGVTKSYDDLTVYQDLDLLLSRGDKIALVGDNGAGKSTLIKMLAGVIPFDGGERTVGHKVDIFYYAQHQLEALDPDRTVLQEMLVTADESNAHLVRDMLGAFRFSGDDVDKKVIVLSGGEKSRLALALMLLQPANLILMDEPTNHLDMQSREILEQALRVFEGTLCFISHDRYFINQVATTVIHIEQGRLSRFPGNYDYYLEKSPSDRSAGTAPAGGSGSSNEPMTDGEDSAGPATDPQSEAPDRFEEMKITGGNEKKALRRAEAERRNRLYRATLEQRKSLNALEAEIGVMEQRKEELETLRATPEVFRDGQRMKTIKTELDDIEMRLSGAYRKWEAIGQELEETLGQIPPSNG